MTYNVAPNFNSEREEFLYESCLKDSDLLATVITEYITRLSDTDLTELDDFLTNNFGDKMTLNKAQLSRTTLITMPTTLMEGLDNESL
jgi:hypothetical protein